MQDTTTEEFNTNDKLGICIVGGGQAGHQLAVSLRSGGYEGKIDLFCKEAWLPYQRPPLSKAYLLNKVEINRLHFRKEEFYNEKNITIHLNKTVTKLDCNNNCIIAGDKKYAYENVILTTGGSARPLNIAGGDADNLLSLRSIEDSETIKKRITQVKKIVVIGGGFIGLEVAASARKSGVEVTVIEAEERLLSRGVALELANILKNLHEKQGVKIITGAKVTELKTSENIITKVCTTKGDFDTDIVIGAIGLVPEVSIAEQAGIDCNAGILVDEQGRTNIQNVFAAGDCTNQKLPNGNYMRIESVQNAMDQAKAIARVILGQEAMPFPVPWFWTDQYDYSLRMAGLYDVNAKTIARGDTKSDHFNLFHFLNDKLISVDSCNDGGTHMIARKLIEKDVSLTYEQVSDIDFPLKILLK